MNAHNKNITVNYDSDADVLSMASSSDATIDHAREMGNLVVHFGKDDEPILVEVLQASQSLRNEIGSLARVVATTPEK